MDSLFALIATIGRECVLFSALFLLLGGLDELAIDALWLKLRWQGRVADRPLSGIASPDAAPPHDFPARDFIAVFVPAWAEAEVIGAMVRQCARSWPRSDVRLYVGCYCNDPATLAALLAATRSDPAVSAMLRIIVVPHDGPTSKADCLNHLWQAMQREEAWGRCRARFIVLHDAEDVVHPQEMAVHERMLPGHAFVQIPVLPFIDPDARWVSAHYIDEFVDNHARTLPVRQALGAALPMAGVGCALERDALGQLDQGTGPFTPDSLTEDYELGLLLSQPPFAGGVFARVLDDDGSLIATRALFPGSIDTAVRQKSRWVMGIALHGWDRTGWSRNLADNWMRLRDRAAPLTALVLLAAYLGLLCWGIVKAGHWAGLDAALTFSPAMQLLLSANGFMLLWRMGMRYHLVSRAYGHDQGVRALIRMPLANLVAMLAARRALARYVAVLAGQPLIWDKTRHHLPRFLQASPPVSLTKAGA